MNMVKNFNQFTNNENNTVTYACSIYSSICT